ncbi:Cycloheximide resistance protein [Pseudocercospora fuligena]|uniref:Cycloheximide resistance protein n=1 Tax=Pseudocercospora fuligena TaxID=685502 RepID=A0A8H6RND8_9PEZI|nr:Cycloheximide resistance protein [Pseudocercospora fuligena]
MKQVFRDSFFGQIVRYVSGNKYFKYAEEEPGFQIPEEYLLPEERSKRRSEVISGVPSEAISDDKPPEDDDDLEKASLAWDGDQAVESGRREHVSPQRTQSGVTTVTWYSDTDPENPHNWPNSKKLWVGWIILQYTLAIYIAASLYTAAIPEMMERWNLGRVAASVGLSIYVIGYGTGPLIMSPLSEIPWIGRNPPYVIGFFLFCIIAIPIAFVDNFAGMLVLRFFLGVAGSPALATGGASYGDFCNGMQMPYAIAIWAGGASAGPSLGPLISNFAAGANWRWPFYETLLIAVPTWLAMFFFLPETSNDQILLRRAQRLRKLTGRNDLMAESEIKAKTKQTREVLFAALVKPWEINMKDPAVLYTTIYLGLVYGIYYSFFESFPIVFGEIYHFSFGIMGAAFLCIAVGCLLAVIVWCGYFYFYADKQMAKISLENVPPEARLAPGLLFTWTIPAGLFIFAWTSRASIHWIVPMIGVTISMMGNFVIAQCVLIYLPFCYPRYVGSLFAANGLSRALLAAAAILFSIPMFENLGVDWGVSLLGFLTVACAVGIYVLFFFGANLRKRSKFAES